MPKCETIEMWTIEENVKLHKQLEVAKDALNKIPHQGFPDEEKYHPWYPHCWGCIAKEALAEIERIENNG
jgi:hypothetical protein